MKTLIFRITFEDTGDDRTVHAEQIMEAPTTEADATYMVFLRGWLPKDLRVGDLIKVAIERI